MMRIARLCQGEHCSFFMLRLQRLHTNVTKRQQAVKYETSHKKRIFSDFLTQTDAARSAASQYKRCDSSTGMRVVGPNNTWNGDHKMPRKFGISRRVEVKYMPLDRCNAAARSIH
jgi:hypothetical protein